MSWNQLSHVSIHFASRKAGSDAGRILEQGDERNYMFYVNRMIDNLFAERFPEYRDLFICRKK